eukprot:4264081-Alexandrium_andersonii.AAC.1
MGPANSGRCATAAGTAHGQALLSTAVRSRPTGDGQGRTWPTRTLPDNCPERECPGGASRRGAAVAAAAAVGAPRAAKESPAVLALLLRRAPQGGG